MVNELAERLSPIGCGTGVGELSPPPQPGTIKAEPRINAGRRACKRLDMAGLLLTSNGGYHPNETFRIEGQRSA
jgi:hypothetical protein